MSVDSIILEGKKKKKEKREEGEARERNSYLTLPSQGTLLSLSALFKDLLLTFFLPHLILPYLCTATQLDSTYLGGIFPILKMWRWHVAFPVLKDLK